jgi:dTMP kinase
MPFLVFEGLDGSGKSTLIQNLESRLKANHQSVMVTREPGGTPLGDELRAILLRNQADAPHPKTELLLYEASRAEHVEKRIRPAIQSGTWVLCDRFEASSIAFQSAGRSISDADVKDMNAFATGGLKAELTVLLDIPVEESIRRMGLRANQTGIAKDRFELEETQFHTKVRQSFLEQYNSAQKNPNSAGIWFKIIGTESPDACLSKLIAEIEKRFGIKLK